MTFLMKVRILLESFFWQKEYFFLGVNFKKFQDEEEEQIFYKKSSQDTLVLKLSEKVAECEKLLDKQNLVSNQLNED